MHRDKKYIWTSILTAIGASLCCITPLLALISGASGMASAFSWLEPLRPYLIGITVLVLVFAWYQKLKPKNEIECDCESDEKPKFVQSKTNIEEIEKAINSTGYTVTRIKIEIK